MSAASGLETPAVSRKFSDFNALTLYFSSPMLYHMLYHKYKFNSRYADRFVSASQNTEWRSENEMNKLPKKPRNENLYKAILSLKDVDECMKFFDDLCTVPELMAMEQRYQVASCLDDGMIYNDILAETGASSATISRVNRSLRYGSGGYAIVFDRMKKGEDK